MSSPDDATRQREEAELRALATRAADGDSAAMDEILRRVQPLVMRRSARMLPCRQDAEEASQDALTSIARKIGSYSGTGSFTGWVAVIATNSARQTYRTLKRRSSELATEILPDAYDPRTTSVIAGSRIDLLEALESMEKTNPALVEAFVLRDLGTLPYNEIADQLGVPLGTVKARIHDARAVMRGQLAERYR